MDEQSSSLDGALVSWKLQSTQNGCVLTLQLVASVQDFKNRKFRIARLTMNDRQLQSFARDIIRATDRRGVKIQAPPSLWERWRRKLKLRTKSSSLS
jgi:hypothetical protein